MRVLIFEPKFVGHFIGFAAVTANAFDELGCQVTLLLPKQAEGTDQAKIKLKKLSDKVEVHYCIDVPKLYERWTNAKFETKALSLALDEFPTEHLVLPSGDFVLSGLLIHGSLRRRLVSLRGVDLVLHNCQQVYPDIGIRKRVMSLLDRVAVSLARSIRIHTVDPFATSSACVSHMSLLGNPVNPLPHFREESPGPLEQEEARRSLDLPIKGKMLGSIGDLGRRKGTELLIKSYARSMPGPQDYLVLFGLLSATAKQELAKAQSLVDRGKIVFRDCFVTDADFHKFFYAMDAIWAGLPHQIGIASTQLYAAEAARPIISSDYGAVGWLTREYGLGRVVPGTVGHMTEAIAWFHQSENWAPEPEGLRRLLEYHCTENFNLFITHAVRQRLLAIKNNGVVPRSKEGVI